jgi:hypothetical protein
METHEKGDQEIGHVGKRENPVRCHQENEKRNDQDVFQKPVLAVEGPDGQEDPENDIPGKKDLKQAVIPEIGPDALCGRCEPQVPLVTHAPSFSPRRELFHTTSGGIIKALPREILYIEKEEKIREASCIVLDRPPADPLISP